MLGVTGDLVSAPALTLRAHSSALCPEVVQETEVRRLEFIRVFLKRNFKKCQEKGQVNIKALTF